MDEHIRDKRDMQGHEGCGQRMLEDPSNVTVHAWLRKEVCDAG